MTITLHYEIDIAVTKLSGKFASKEELKALIEEQLWEHILTGSDEIETDNEAVYQYEIQDWGVSPSGKRFN